MNYRLFRYSAITIFILLVGIIIYSMFMWQNLQEQGDALQGQADELSKKMEVIKDNEQTKIIEAQTVTIDPPELKKLRDQHDRLKRYINNKNNPPQHNDAISKRINELLKKITTLEKNRKTVTTEASTIISFNGPLSTKQKLDLKKLDIQYDEIQQSLKELGRWDADKRKEISLSRFGEAAMLIIVPYFIFLIPILLSLIWKELLHRKAFISSCVAACYSCLPVYFYAVLFPVKNTLGYGYVTIFMLAGFALLLGIITFGVSYLITKRFYKLNY